MFPESGTKRGEGASAECDGPAAAASPRCTEVAAGVSDRCSAKSDALPLIWQENDRFQKAAEAAKTATAALRDAVKSGDKAAISKSMKPVFESCKGCHDRYRKEED